MRGRLGEAPAAASAGRSLRSGGREAHARRRVSCVVRRSSRSLRTRRPRRVIGT
ncbi:hypothetical protein BMA721280_0075 [Burkholderia mallei 2002721280]|uniref:Uncharacterized protein n=2 Tax=pseudomallei group TaxID=111527 RepID=A2S7V3_BURM9|nr:hypothetical protein BMA10229_A2058 [Burkholderia mallei NCTC 10229]ACQ98909.1 hypothetical protein GBP346_A0227 [Burkholderia pseudomallei MSHR346]EBA45188.1 hypothetical protein BURPS305_0663 [Burkholderia pseudomallei 305]EDK54900.1 hypothetical protein BMAFMH_B0856 [Burkholderia mallei FMH]EDK59874.1 hypothetical protein BMAJHU_B0835 [Burkholderia mallei JHU]EDK86911.1 hypothetical protein BMA721280_0075 [Burkholderia mallei 2002721280]EDO91385.1 hypothetical protein BURPSPAST_Z0618 [B